MPAPGVLAPEVLAPPAVVLPAESVSHRPVVKGFLLTRSWHRRECGGEPPARGAVWQPLGRRSIAGTVGGGRERVGGSRGRRRAAHPGAGVVALTHPRAPRASAGAGVASVGRVMKAAFGLGGVMLLV